MKTAVQDTVKLYENPRSNGTTEYVLSWYVNAGLKPNGKPKRARQRRSFLDRPKAVEEKNRLEDTLSKAADIATTLDPHELVEFALLKKQLKTVPVSRIFAFWKEHHGLKAEAPVTPIEEIVKLFLESCKKKSERYKDSLKYRLAHFVKCFKGIPIQDITPLQIQDYYTNKVEGSDCTKYNHFASVRTMFEYARRVLKLLPYREETAPIAAGGPEYEKTGHELYSPEELTRILLFAPSVAIPWIAVGAFTGARAAERSRMTWGVWREQKKKLVLERNITKTKIRRTPDVPDNLGAWLKAFKEDDQDLLLTHNDPYEFLLQVHQKAGVPSKHNGLRSSYASYHMELHEKADSTAKNCGHSVRILQTEYMEIKGVDKESAAAWFNVTPQSVLDYAKEKGLPLPVWAARVTKQSEGSKKPEESKEAEQTELPSEPLTR